MRRTSGMRLVACVLVLSHLALLAAARPRAFADFPRYKAHALQKDGEQTLSCSFATDVCASDPLVDHASLFGGAHVTGGNLELTQTGVDTSLFKGEVQYNFTAPLFEFTLSLDMTIGARAVNPEDTSGASDGFGVHFGPTCVAGNFDVDCGDGWSVLLNEYNNDATSSPADPTGYIYYGSSPRATTLQSFTVGSRVTLNITVSSSKLLVDYNNGELSMDSPLLSNYFDPDTGVQAEWQLRIAGQILNINSAHTIHALTLSAYVDDTPPNATVTLGGVGSTVFTRDNGNTYVKTNGLLVVADLGGETGVDFLCELNGASHTCAFTYRVTQDHYEYDLSGLDEGTYSFKVTARDKASNLDPNPTTFVFIVDYTAPTTSIQTGPAEGEVWTQDTATFTFNSDEANMLYTCALSCVDDNAASECSALYVTPSMPDGNCTLTMVGSDYANNNAPSVVRTFEVELPPEVEITMATTAGTFTTGQAGNVNALNLTLTFTEPVFTLDPATVLSITPSTGVTVSLLEASSVGDVYVLQAVAGVDGEFSFVVEAGTVVDDYNSGNLESNTFVHTVDTTPPTLNVTLVSTNPNPAYATLGDNLTLTIVASESVSTPNATVDGSAVDLGVSGTTFSAEYVPGSGTPEGVVGLLVDDYEDWVGNAGQAYTELTALSSVIWDVTPPTITSLTIQTDNTINSAYGRVGSTVTVALLTSEFVTTPSVSLNGHALSVNGDGTNFTATYELQESDDEGVMALLVSAYADRAGNVGQNRSDTPSTVTFDKTAPVLLLKSVRSNSSIIYTRAKVGDEITVRLQALEDLVDLTISIAGNSVPTTVDTNSTLSGVEYVATYTMGESDSEGSIVVVVPTLTDLAGNTGGGQSYTSSVEFDRTAPEVTITATANLNAMSNGGYTNDDVLTFTFRVSERPLLGDFVVGSQVQAFDTCSSSFASTTTIGDLYYYKLLCAASDGDRILVQVNAGDLQDEFGNALATNVSFYLVSDQTPPVLSIPSMLPLSDPSNLADLTRTALRYANLTLGYDDASPASEQYCRLDRYNHWPSWSRTVISPWEPCSELIDFDELTSGDYGFQMYAKDAAGNIGSTLVFNWTIATCNVDRYCANYDYFCIYYGDWDNAIVPDEVNCNYCFDLNTELFGAGCWDVFLICDGGNPIFFSNGHAPAVSEVISLIETNIVAQNPGCEVPSQSASPSPTSSPTSSPSMSPSPSVTPSVSVTPSATASTSFTPSISFSPSISVSREPPQYLISTNLESDETDGFAFANGTYTVTGDYIRYSDIDATVEVYCGETQFRETLNVADGNCMWLLRSSMRILNPDGYSGFRVWNVTGENNVDKTLLAEVDLTWKSANCVWVDGSVCNMLPLSDNAENGALLEYYIERFPGDERTRPLVVTWVDSALVPHSMRPEINATLIEFEQMELDEGSDLSFGTVWSQQSTAFVAIFVFGAVLFLIVFYSCCCRQKQGRKKQEVYVINTHGLRTVHQEWRKEVSHKDLRMRNRFSWHHSFYLLIILGWRIARIIVFTFTFFYFAFKAVNHKHLQVVDEMDTYSLYVADQTMQLSVDIEDYYTKESQRIEDQYRWQTDQCQRETVMENAFVALQDEIEAYHDEEIDKRRNSQLSSEPVLYALSSTQACTTSGATFERNQLNCYVNETLVYLQQDGAVCDDPLSHTPDEWKTILKAECETRREGNSTGCVGFGYNTDNDDYFLYTSFAETAVDESSNGYCYGYNSYVVTWPGESIDDINAQYLAEYQQEVNNTYGISNNILDSLQDNQILHLTFDYSATSWGIQKIYRVEIDRALGTDEVTYDIWATYGCPACPEGFELPSLQQVEAGEVTYATNQTVTVTAQNVSVSIDERFASMVQFNESYFPDLIDFPTLTMEFWNIDIDSKLFQYIITLDLLLLVYRIVMTVAVLSRYARGIEKTIPLTMLGRRHDLNWAKGVCASCCFLGLQKIYRALHHMDQTLWMLFGKLIRLMQIALLACVVLLGYWIVDQVVDMSTFEEMQVFASVSGAPAAQRIIRNEQIALRAYSYNEIMAAQLALDLQIKASELTSRQKSFNEDEKDRVDSFNEEYCSDLLAAVTNPFLLDTTVTRNDFEASLAASLPYGNMTAGGVLELELSNPSSDDGADNYIIDEITLTWAWEPPDTSQDGTTWFESRSDTVCGGGVQTTDGTQITYVYSNDDCSSSEPWCLYDDDADLELRRELSHTLAINNGLAIAPLCAAYAACTSASPCSLDPADLNEFQSKVEPLTATLELVGVVDPLLDERETVWQDSVSAQANGGLSSAYETTCATSNVAADTYACSVSESQLTTLVDGVRLEENTVSPSVDLGGGANQTLAKFLRLTIDPSSSVSSAYYTLQSVRVVGHIGSADTFECDEVAWRQMEFEVDDEMLGNCSTILPIHGYMMRKFDRQSWTDALREGFRPFVFAFRNICLSPFVILLSLILLFLVVELSLSLLEWFLVKTDLIRQNTFARVPCAIAKNLRVGKGSKGNARHSVELELTDVPQPGEQPPPVAVGQVAESQMKNRRASVGSGSSSSSSSSSDGEAHGKDDAKGIEMQSMPLPEQPQQQQQQQSPPQQGVPPNPAKTVSDMGAPSAQPTPNDDLSQPVPMAAKRDSKTGSMLRRFSRQKEQMTSIEQLRESHVWQEFQTPDGKSYFFNPYKNETVWVLPEGEHVEYAE